MVSSFMSSRHHGRSKADSPTSGCCPRSAKQQAHFSACRHAFELGAAGGAHLQRQDSDTYIFCLSWLPDSGMILIGSHEDRAPDAESCARPSRLVELPALLDHPFDHPDDPTGPVWIRPGRRGIQPEQARSVWSRSRSTPSIRLRIWRLVPLLATCTRSCRPRLRASIGRGGSEWA
jgi:hypothetical protein